MKYVFQSVFRNPIGVANDFIFFAPKDTETGLYSHFRNVAPIVINQIYYGVVGNPMPTTLPRHLAAITTDFNINNSHYPFVLLGRNAQRNLLYEVIARELKGIPLQRLGLAANPFHFKVEMRPEPEPNKIPNVMPEPETWQRLRRRPPQRRT